MNRTNISSFLLLILIIVEVATAHSYLAFPEPYNRCDNSGIHVCPRFRRNPLQDKKCVKKFTSENIPAATWKRGHEVSVRWVRNNHAGVPVSRMFEEKAHKDLAFYYGCWEQGKYECKGDACGTDSKSEGFRRTIKVPDVLPDGLYVLSFLWYGGCHFKRKQGKFSDYSSCSYVRINGGYKQTFRYQPFFDAGELGEFENNGKCLTSATFPGQCRLSCPGKKSFHAQPFPFGQNKKPRILKQSDFFAVRK